MKFISLCKKSLLSLVFIFFIHQWSYGQTGTITGKITDKKNGEALIGVSVLVKELGTGAATNVNGKYFIKDIDTGSYTLQVTYVSYQKKIIEDVQVKPNDVTTLNIELAPEDMELEEVTVKAKQVDNTEAALLSIQKKSLSVQDGISSEQMKRLGSSNAAQSMEKVTGATVEDGKYMVVRGLGDRYSITQMNNVTMPSTDPYRNSTSMDLIPADMIDNITTAKTFTPDQPGNFTGGRVNINTKSMPEKFTLNFGVSMGYNTNATFNQNFLKDRVNGKYDWLGYDDGSRAEPKPVRNGKNRKILLKTNERSVIQDLDNYPQNENLVNQAQIIDEASESFDDPYHPTQGAVPFNQGYNFSIGNQYEVAGNPLGVMLGVNYSKSYELYSPDAVVKLWEIRDSEAPEMERVYDYNSRSASDKTQLGGVSSVSYQFDPDHELSLNYMYNHKGNSAVTTNVGKWPGAIANSASKTFHSDIVNFEERSFHNAQLKGKHYFNNFKDLKFDWVAGYTKSKKHQPNLRLFPYTTNDEASRIVETDTGYTKVYFKQYEMNKSETDLPYNYFRDLDDQKYNFQGNFTLPVTDNDENKVKFGFSYSNTQRDFDETYYQLNNDVSGGDPGLSFQEAGGDFDAYFDRSNYGITHVHLASGDTVSYSDDIDKSRIEQYFFGNYIDNQTQPSNSYTGHRIVGAGYVMGVYQVMPRLKLIGGLRVETTDLKAESESEETQTGEIKEVDLLPSLNLKYALTEDMNLRGAASRTLARPNMREIAPFAAFGGVGFASVSGNPDLQRTLIQNYDARWEYFPNPGELIALSTYYKRFTNPIIWQLLPEASSANMKPANVDKANVVGAEVEFRKSLDFISPALRNFKIASNFSYIYSRVPKNQNEINKQEELGRDLKDWRPFQNQSPYIINAALSHQWEKLQWENSVSFNIWGPRLAFVTEAKDPDVYEQPRPSLNFISNKNFGEHYSLGFQVNNILNMTYLFEQDFKGGQYIRERYRLGTTFNLSFSYKI